MDDMNNDNINEELRQHIKELNDMLHCSIDHKMKSTKDIEQIVSLFKLRNSKLLQLRYSNRDDKEGKS